MKRPYQRPPYWGHLNPLRLIQICMCICASTVFAQPTPLPTPATDVLPPMVAPSLWSDLDPGQRQALHPLKNSWSELSDIQRRKWIAIVKNFPKLPPEDQAKVQERMSAWAALTPNERERARENYASSKLAQPSTKVGSWEEYRALPQEERDKLASQTTKKRPSAAKKTKPQPVIAALNGSPTPPHTPPVTEERSNLRNLVTPSTLLPRSWLPQQP